VGLVTASAAVIAEASAETWLLAGIIALSAFLTATTRIHPLLVLAGGAAIGLSGPTQF
jgi:chromate transporter